jgi:hypothetical protein
MPRRGKNFRSIHFLEFQKLRIYFLQFAHYRKTPPIGREPFSRRARTFRSELVLVNPLRTRYLKTR